MIEPLKLFFLLTTWILGSVFCSGAEDTPIKLGEVTYLPRWAENDQHEYTPKGQEDLQRWTDMVTINYYRKIKDGDGLAAQANAVLAAYKNNGAIVIKTGSVPRTADRAAEYLIVVYFHQPDFIEAVFARLMIVDQTALAVIYSHRIYGQKVADPMNTWLEESGPAAEKVLMEMKEIPAVVK